MSKSDKALIRIADVVRRAIDWTADVIQRGRLRIGWRFDALTNRFYVLAMVGSRVVDGWVLDRFQFGRMFRFAPHWIGGVT
jgi:hypothetical protein